MLLSGSMIMNPLIRGESTQGKQPARWSNNDILTQLDRNTDTEHHFTCMGAVQGPAELPLACAARDVEIDASCSWGVLI